MTGREWRQQVDLEEAIAAAEDAQVVVFEVPEWLERILVGFMDFFNRRAS